MKKSMGDGAQQMRPPGWYRGAPIHFDSAWPCWLKLSVALGIFALSFLIDHSAAVWAFHTHLHLKSDIKLEMTMLGQYGQWTCSILVILAVGMLDKEGRKKALAIALGCLATVLVCYLLKGMFGRTRPWAYHNGNWSFLGPAYGFTNAKYQSFPSAHTTGSFALSAGLSWFYPRGRALFYALALDVAFQRVLEHAHFPSDTIAGMILAIVVVRSVLYYGVPAKIIHILPLKWQKWYLAANVDVPAEAAR